jgi:hypothetical protein
MALDRCIATLRAADVELAAGLSAEEVVHVEATFGFTFPADLRELLMAALPISHGFANWRDDDPTRLRERFEWPFEGIRFDIEVNAFWLNSWGPRPTELAEAIEVARQKVALAPMLIPICGHRFLPDRPRVAGNPVLSVVQTDIIYYGRNLENYLENELLQGVAFHVTEPIRRIELWSELID